MTQPFGNSTPADRLAKDAARALRQYVRKQGGDVSALEDMGLLDWEMGGHPETTDCTEMVGALIATLSQDGCASFAMAIMASMMEFVKNRGRSYKVDGVAKLAQALSSGETGEDVIRELIEEAFS